MKKNPKIAIIDYGLGNIFSINKALKIFTENVVITESGNGLGGFDALILPGVGSFKAGMAGLEIRDLVEPVRSFAKSGKPILGICLGAQLMLDKGYEFGECNGMGIISGKVIKFPQLSGGVKIPHIGWNRIRSSALNLKDKLLSSVKNGSYFYFVHSYTLEPKKKENVLAETEYGGHKFCSIIKSGNVYGCQFHPEKSGEVGLKFLANFIELARGKRK